MRIITFDYDVTILVTIEANDVFSHVLILNYFNNNNSEKNLKCSIQMFG
jgi:hypothetical protein